MPIKSSQSLDLGLCLGEQAAMGLSPFGIDSWNDAKNELGESYGVLQEMIPLLAEHQATGDLHGFVLDKDRPSVTFVIQGVELEVSLDEIFGRQTETGFGLVLATGPNRFLGAGKGFRVGFKNRTNAAGRLGIGLIEGGRFDNGKWISGRRLNGDENDQGQYWRFDPRTINVERLELYHYE
jgi:Domain of unknown function (DUF5597)